MIYDLRSTVYVVKKSPGVPRWRGFVVQFLEQACGPGCPRVNLKS